MTVILRKWLRWAGNERDLEVESMRLQSTGGFTVYALECECAYVNVQCLCVHVSDREMRGGGGSEDVFVCGPLRS